MEDGEEEDGGRFQKGRGQMNHVDQKEDIYNK